MHSDKIPNWLIVVGIFVGTMTTNDFLGSILSFFVVCLCFFPFFAIGALGAGDIKCIAMTGFYLHADQLVKAIFYIFTIAAVFSLLKIISNKFLQEKIAHFFSYLWRSFRSRTFFPYETEFSDNETINNHTIHLALPIFLGVFLSVGGTFL